MKKLVFLFAMVFAVSVAMAQSNESIVTVNGDSNSADVTQAGTDNYSNLQQTNDNNEYTLEQTGDENSSKLKQGATPGSYKENIAEITQNGNLNKLRNYSNGNAAVQGRENYLWVNQQGDENTAGVYQDSYDHDAYIDQTGFSNDAFVKQDAHKSYAEIEQVGDDNVADIKQEGDGGHFAQYAVVGSNNSLTAEQRGFDNDLIVDQTWTDMVNDGNVITAYQNNISAGLGNRAYLRMTGSDNTVHLQQNGSWNQIGGKGMFPDLAPADVTVADMLNYKGDNSTIDIEQMGNQNVVQSEMNNSYGDIDIVQSGNLNITELFINVGGMGSGNTADIQQLSNSNTSVNTVTGDSNAIVVVQN